MSNLYRLADRRGPARSGASAVERTHDESDETIQAGAATLAELDANIALLHARREAVRGRLDQALRDRAERPAAPSRPKEAEL